MSTELYEAMVKIANGSLSDKEKTLITPFLKSYYALSNDEELQDYTPVSLYATALSHFRSLQQYNGKKAIINTYNPKKDEHGYDSEFSVVDIITQDRPFLIDSLQMAFVRKNLAIQFITHPIYRYELDENKSISSLHNTTESSLQNISVVHIEFDKLPRDQLEEVTAEICHVIEQLNMATNDWQHMSNKVQDVIGQIQSMRGLPQTIENVLETIHFLDWLRNKHFTFLGYREYELKGNDLYIMSNTGLGVLRDDGNGGISKSYAQLPQRLKDEALKPELLLFSKSNNLSVIHRPAYMDFIGIKKFDDKGNVVGEHRFLGLLTSEAYRLPPKDIPMLSDKINGIVEQAALPLNSHARKSFENILAQFPRDELFQSSADQIRDMALRIYHLHERDSLRFFARTDTFETYVSCYIYVPKERYNTKLREKFEVYLMKKLGGYATEFSTFFSESLHVRVHIMVRTKPGHITQFDSQKIEHELTPMMLDWGDETIRLLQEERGRRAGNSLFKTFEKSIPSDYKDDFSPTIAINDFTIVSNLSDEHPIGVNLYQVENDSDTSIRLKLYGRGEIAALSDLLPILENFGFIVKSAKPYQFSHQGDTLAWIVNFNLRLERPLSKPLSELAPHFSKAFTNTWTGIDESDAFDKLVISNGLSPRNITMLRAVSRYMLQAKAPFSGAYMQQAINNNADIAEQLVAFFHARMGLETDNRDELQSNIIKLIEEKLSTVASLDEDKIIRWFMTVINAMVRTNFFQLDAEGKEKTYVSFKIESAKIPDLPLPKPLFEIFVYSTDVEAIHLRGGKVARGGLRWSDRVEDFRTEVLGLVKAQIVKNSVIVPVGSKGGFIVRKPDNSSREAFINEGIRCYKIFMRGLLDITDNIVSGKIVAPANVHRHDEDDPYLVVAADKGTATFSDIANSMSAEYGFWLGDAFASGGSVGYDHKGMGITARGAWESVKRHFRHLGKDIQKEEFTVVGVGDMGGDVFGNGMLLSEKIQLTAAFNHMHIFIDPTPNAATTFIERKRLFETPRTTWDDFDKSLISQGGGVFSRSDKSISITPEMKEAFAISEDSLSPNQLINRLLKAPVDLLWNGGIGTYVKAETESHAEVGDKANDVLRINGSELNCKVIGEGGNLGFTQLGRIEFAKKGGHVLTDAIDNSAGVNCSDHEVNIKILLNQLVESGEMTTQERNVLLESMTEEVGHLVLRQNYQQPQAISISEQNKSLFLDHIRIMQQMEKDGQLNRELEFLPNDDELQRRLNTGESLYAPELAVMLAYSKIDVFNELIESDLPDASFFQEDLTLYFPTALREKYTDAMKTHRLRREIITTFITNSILNHMGSIFIHRTKEKTGQSTEQIVLAYCAARNIFKAREYWSSIDALDNIIDADLQNNLHRRMRSALETASNWFLSRRRDNINIEVLEQEFAKIGAVSKQLPKVLSRNTFKLVEEEIQSLVEQGVPKNLASDLAYMPHLVKALDAIDLAGKQGVSVSVVTEVYFGVADKLYMRWLASSIDSLYNNDYWRRRACHSLLDNLHTHIASVTEQVIKLDSNADKAIEVWMEKRASLLDNYINSLTEIRKDEVDLSRLSVVIGEMSALARAD
ncbi:MAG: NAD-glutamate dehydrogenase [Gammaproteobacteria bacterium]|nr:NAD-glutamate dehydrogenase [Gammaproteobacteria bacterium]